VGVAALLLVFNRPAHTAQALAALLQSSPTHIYVSGDGPRPGHDDDVAQVAAVWKLLIETSWPCPVTIRQLPRNVGCHNAVVGAMDWFFEHEERGIVVEDDVVLAAGALATVDRLLDYGATQPDVGSVTAFNAVPRRHITDPSCSFRRSIYTYSQGWGTWSSRWSLLRRNFEGWREWLPESQLTSLGGGEFSRYWTRRFDSDSRYVKDGWDYLWLATSFSYGWTTLASNANLCENVGFDRSASFSPSIPSWWPRHVDHWEPSMWRIPSTMAVDARADAWMSRNAVGISRVKALKRWTAAMAPWSQHLYRRLAEASGPSTEQSHGAGRGSE
jgi:hypothetical protein